MDEFENLKHTKWECKCHVVFIPKCRRKVLYLEEVFRALAVQKESRIEDRLNPVQGISFACAEIPMSRSWLRCCHYLRTKCTEIVPRT